MTCLWLTLADPEPATNGQYLYSGGLIQALAGTGASLCVIGLSRPESAPRRDGRHLSWRLADEMPASKWAGLLSKHPQIAVRCRTVGLRSHLAAALARGQWDTIVFDSISMGWALDAVLRYRKRQARPATLVYLSHNHERTAARHIAGLDRSVLTGLLKRLDAAKVDWLERRLVQEADLVSANTPEDAALFAGERPERPVIVLPPGYSGQPCASRLIDSGIPRRAVVVGSFDWLPKRASLEAFLDVAAPAFEKSGIELQIVGQSEEAYLATLGQRFPTVQFTGAVPDVVPYMQQARMALVPDQLGGFKLKALDYVFNRLPILAMKGAVPGVPLQEGASIRSFDTHAALAQGVIGMMGDLDALNAQQEAAYAACEAAFAWPHIGRHLALSIAAAGWRGRRPGDRRPLVASGQAAG